MIMSERQPRMTKKREREPRLLAYAREARVERRTQSGEAGRADVGQLPRFDVAPHRFDGVQHARVPVKSVSLFCEIH